MESQLRQYALALWGEYVRQKRIANNWLQQELGVRLEYGVNGAKQAVSQLEHGRSWIPKNRFPVFQSVLKLDESLFRRLDYHFSAREYAEMAQLLRELLESEFGYAPPPIESVSEAMTTTGETGPNPLHRELTQRLSTLKEAYEQALIDEEEYVAARKRILEQFVEGA